VKVGYVGNVVDAAVGLADALNGYCPAGPQHVPVVVGSDFTCSLYEPIAAVVESLAEGGHLKKRSLVPANDISTSLISIAVPAPSNLDAFSIASL
jgi:hypothetical protein